MSAPVRIDGYDTQRVRDGEIVTTPDGTAHYLNPMATLIYELADGRAVESITASVTVIFQLPGQEAAYLVEQALAEMREKGLVA